MREEMRTFPIYAPKFPPFMHCKFAKVVVFFGENRLTRKKRSSRQVLIHCKSMPILWKQQKVLYTIREKNSYKCEWNCHIVLQKSHMQRKRLKMLHIKNSLSMRSHNRIELTALTKEVKFKTTSTNILFS